MAGLCAIVSMKNANSAQNCTQMKPLIRTYDESNGKWLTGDAFETIANSHFKRFVSTLSNYIANKINEKEECPQTSTPDGTIILSFVYRPLITNTKPYSAPTFPSEFDKKTSNICRIDSPWVKLSLSYVPQLTLNAVITWNERQMMVDQAVLNGADMPPPGSPIAPIEDTLFEKYITDYSNTVLLAASPEARVTAQTNIEKRIPSEVLWLFRHAWQSTFAPFSMEARHALGTLQEKAEPHYILLAETLVSRCFESANVNETYKSILELSKIFNVDIYRIETLH